MYVRSLPLIPTRIILFTSLLISACILSVNQVPQITPRSSIIYSQDISLITDLPKQRQRLDYLLLANPLEEFPHFIIKYKDQPKLVSVKIPQATQINLEREVLLKNKIPFAIAQKEWLDKHEQILEAPASSPSIWHKGFDLLQRNIVGISCLLLLLLLIKKGLPEMSGAVKITRPGTLKGSFDDLIGMEDVKREILHLEEMISQRHLYKSHNISLPSLPAFALNYSPFHLHQHFRKV